MLGKDVSLARSLTHRIRLDLAVDVGEIVPPEPDLDLTGRRVEREGKKENSDDFSQTSASLFRSLTWSFVCSISVGKTSRLGTGGAHTGIF